MARITDGHGTRLEFSIDTALVLYEVRVTPPGIDGGDEIDTTIMTNATWRTRAPRQLKTLTNGGAVVNYDPQQLAAFVAAIGRNQLVTINWPDGSSWTFWGYLKNFTPQEVEEGAMPLADIEIVPTNMDNSNAEQPPAYVAP